MLDVITIVSESTPKNYVLECRRSIAVAIGHAPFRVNYIEVPGVPGHIGRAMKAGLDKAPNPYVAFVDDDDFVLPNAFACLGRHFDKLAQAICAREIQLLANGFHIMPDRRHHLTAFSRGAIRGVDLEQHPAFPNAALHKATPNAVHELSWVYMHRIRRSEGSKLRAQASDTDRSAL